MEWAKCSDCNVSFVAISTRFTQLPQRNTGPKSYLVMEVDHMVLMKIKL